MSRFAPLLVAGALLAGVGCEKKEDPRNRPDFIDTSDPSKVSQTMKAPPKGGKNPTDLTGGRGGKMPGSK